MTVYISAVLILFIVQTFSSALTQFGPMGNNSIAAGLGGRDELADRSPISARLERAKANMMEALPIFLTLALLHVMNGPAPELALNGALIFLIARIVYIPAYASGIIGVRTAVWGVGHAGLLMMALAF